MELFIPDTSPCELKIPHFDYALHAAFFLFILFILKLLHQLQMKQAPDGVRPAPAQVPKAFVQQMSSFWICDKSTELFSSSYIQRPS